MSTETLAPSVRETQISTPETVEPALKEALHSFYDLPFDPQFNELCVSRGLNPEDTGKPAYWEAAADFASSTPNAENGEDEKYSALKELFAATPDFIYQQKILEHESHKYAAHNVYQNARERASYYNGLIRHVAQEWPDIRASVLATSLMNVVNISIERTDIKQSSLQGIRETIRGAQHELAFGQLLAHTGRDFRSANVGEDLHGIDYVVSDPNGSTILIDVKASQHTLERRGSSMQPYIRSLDGQLTMSSLVTDTELNDRFFVSERLAVQRAETLNRILTEASSPQSRTIWLT